MKTETKKYLKIGAGILLLYLFIHYWDTIAGMIAVIFASASPLLIGAVVAYPVNIIMSFYERHWLPKSQKNAVIQTRRIACLLLAILSMLGIVALVILLVIPQLVDAILLLLSEVPAAMQQVITWAESLEILPEDIFSMLENIDWKSQVSKIISFVTSGVGSVVGAAVNIVSAVFSSVFNALLAVIFALYLLLSKETLGRQCRKIMSRYLKPELNQKLFHVLNIINDCFHKYIVGQCTEALILGAMCTIGMLIFQFPYATMVGALVAFTALIPIAGAYIGAGVGAFMIMTVDPMKAVLFLIYIVILQQLEGNIIYPRVVGSSIGLPGIWVLAAVTVGGGVMGIPGMLLDVPLAAAAYRLLREDINREKPGKPVKKEATPSEQA
ncbi:MAG: AI-2E family transporter [Ruminococcus sp.]|nr:AI-2E family transporter [Ruminococcus sp.]